jgi:ubiquitin-protein ligase E3 C
MKQAGLTEQTSEWRENITDILRQYEFLGRIVGKCLYEGILVDIGFAAFFLLKWAASGAVGSEGGYRANINDLRDLDESLYQGLLKLKNYPGNVEDLSLDFTIDDTISLPGTPTQRITRELMPNGSNIPVTNENRPLYVSYVARHRLQLQPYQQTQAFLRGLGEIIKPSWLSMFNQSELQTLIGGDSSEIDVEDLRVNTAYGGIYQIGDDGIEHHTIRLFWKVMKELDDSDRRKVLKYVTSTPRAPLLGFSQLNPRFSIRDAGSDEERLPSTSTCVNLLKLPKYSTAATLRSKLLYAVNSGAGFDLS